jgi:hypothetical protein
MCDFSGAGKTRNIVAETSETLTNVSLFALLGESWLGNNFPGLSTFAKHGSEVGSNIFGKKIQCNTIRGLAS